MTTETVATTAPAAETRVCAATGLGLIAATGQVAWRVQKTSFGALNPRVPKPDDDPHRWGRWDVLGHQTIYAARSPAGALVETLQAFRLEATNDPPLHDLFDDETGETTVLEAVAQDWAREWGDFFPGKIPQGWRESRNLYQLRLPTNGWLVDIDDGHSVSVIGQALKDELRELGVDRFTVQQLYEDDRALRLTTMIAEWIWRQLLDDGHLPHGIRYRSKWGGNYGCYALWLRALDDGKGLDSEPTRLLGAQCINRDDSALNEAAGIHRLTRIF